MRRHPGTSAPSVTNKTDMSGKTAKIAPSDMTVLNAMRAAAATDMAITGAAIIDRGIAIATGTAVVTRVARNIKAMAAIATGLNTAGRRRMRRAIATRP